MRKDKAYLNVYEMLEDTAMLRIKTFAEDLLEWIDFVCDCRDGKSNYLSYDIIKGKVANDKVFRVVDLYHAGSWDKERPIREIKVYPGYVRLHLLHRKQLISCLCLSLLMRCRLWMKMYWKIYIRKGLMSDL